MDCRLPCLKLTQTHVHWVSDAIQPSHPLLPLPSIFPSIRVFSNESVLRIRWPKYWSFSFSICPSHEYSGLISSRMDCLDLLAVQGTLKSLLQHHSSKASILWCSAFFIVQLSHPYVTIGKSRALTRWAFVGKVMSLSRLVIAFLTRSKHLLISCLQSSSAVILEPKKIKSVTPSIFSPSIYHSVLGRNGMIVIFWMRNFKLALHFLLSLSSRGCLVPLCFLQKCGVICISEVINISPSNLDSSLCFIQPSISLEVHCIWIKKARLQYTALMYSVSNLEAVCHSMSGSNCCFLACIQISQEAGKWKWSHSVVPDSLRPLGQ